jgi:hypothetical protein
MTEPEKPKRALRQFTSAEFAPYALAVGQTALAWNDLQEKLAELFAAVLMPQSWGLSFAMWHSLKSDRAQREMLEGAVRWLKDNGSDRPAVAKAILKFLGQISDFEIERNDVIHAPLESQGYTWGPLMAALMAEWAVLPSLFQDNPRALGLDRRATKRKGLLTQLHLSRDTFMALADHAFLLMKAVCDPNEPLPDKLQLPNRGDKTASQGRQPRD